MGPGGPPILADGAGNGKGCVARAGWSVYRPCHAFIGLPGFDTRASPLLKLDVLQGTLHSFTHLDPYLHSGPVSGRKEPPKRPRPTPFMDQILHKLGELVLGSVPTIALFILLVIAYGLLVRRPLDKVLAERRARTSGAVEQARGAIAAAEAETSVYEDRLRAAKNEIFQARDQKLKQWTAERDAVLEQVQQAAQERIRAARQEIEQGATAARMQIEGLSSELSAQILKAVLPAGVAAPEVMQ
jgi:F-type H+-transporting ATPase subunit b